MYLTYNDNYWAIDIEGDPIPSTRVWCAVAINVVTREVVRLVGEDEVKEWFTEKAKDRRNKFIGHNILGYDAPTLNRLLDTNIQVSACIDTMLMSMFYSPSLEGGHSLAAWGTRLKFPKDDFNDFDKYSDEMLRYCERDTELCLRVYLALTVRMQREEFTEEGIDLEHKSWFLIKKQQETGFPFNEKEAHILYAKVLEKVEDIRQRIYHYWPPELKIVATYKQAKKKDGTYTANYLRHKEQYVRVQENNEGGYYAWDYVEFNLGSPDQRRQKLLELGWEPREFTKPSKTFPDGQAKVTDKGSLVPSLQEFVEESGREEVTLIAKWIDLNSRATMINTWLEAYNDRSGRIHGSLWLANTLRYRHSEPNTANIPAVRVYEAPKDNPEKVFEGVEKTYRDGEPFLGEDGVFTYEARDLWTCGDNPDYRLVGVDAKGIQLRVLAHHLNNPEFTHAVLDGDPHSYNQEIGGFRTRPIAKTFIYAFLLGAGDAKVGQIIGGSAKDGRAIKRRFIVNFPGLDRLLADLERQVDRTGRIRLCDGTPIIVDKMHTRLGYLLQGDENRIMKKAAVLAHAECIKRGLDVTKVGDIHDEWQSIVHKDSVDELCQSVYPDAFRRAGRSFNYRLPIGCDSKVGLTWAETH